MIARVVARGLAAAVVACAVLAGIAPNGARPAAAQTDGVTMELVSASPWVTHDGTWSARLRISGAPVGATIDYTIAQPVTGSEPEVRRALEEIAGSSEGLGILQPPSEGVDLATVTSADGFTALDVPIRSQRTGARDRALIPEPGTFPLIVTVRSATGDTLATGTYYLNRLPTGEAPREPFRLALLVQAHGDLAFDDEGAAAVSATTRSDLGLVADLLEAGAGLRSTVDLRPQIPDALAADGDPNDQHLLERLQRAVAGRTVLGSPWAQLHTEGLAGDVEAVRGSLQDGQTTLLVRLLAPTDTTVWAPDDTVGPAAVDLLRDVGTTGLVVAPDQLTDERPPGDESGYSRPFVVEGRSGGLAAFALDPTLQGLLAPDDVTAAPTLRAHRALSQLFATWLADDEPRGAVILLDPTVDVDAARTLMATLAAATGAGSAPDDVPTPIAVTPLPEVLRLPPITSRQAGRDAEWTRELREVAVPAGVDAVGASVASIRPLLVDYTQMFAASDPGATRASVLVRRSLDARRDATAQAAIVAEVRRELRDDLARISASEPRTLTVTSRRSAIPLRFQNDTGRPIQVRLRLESPRLAFRDGALQRLTLEPGLNRLDVEVEVQASGQFTLQADLLAPRSGRVLASTRQRIRSSAFSGVGLMLSGGALLFLVIWWSRTLRRRSREAASGDGATVAPGARR